VKHVVVEFFDDLGAGYVIDFTSCNTRNDPRFLCAPIDVYLVKAQANIISVWEDICKNGTGTIPITRDITAEFTKPKSFIEWVKSHKVLCCLGALAALAVSILGVNFAYKKFCERVSAKDQASSKFQKQ
jgi:hypothetical protein